jgi:hypothetical protein
VGAGLGVSEFITSTNHCQKEQQKRLDEDRQRARHEDTEK